MLNWHYRSRHQSLIAVSNREFYENRLFIVPSPYDAIAGMGLKLNYLPHAQYDRGNTRTNPIEARSVAEAVIGHALEKPEQFWSRDVLRRPTTSDFEGTGTSQKATSGNRRLLQPEFHRTILREKHREHPRR